MAQARVLKRIRWVLREPRGSVLILLLLILSLRVPPLLLGHGLPYAEDEMEMTFSVLDRWLGLPSTSLAWPGSTLQILALPLLTLMYLASAAPSLSPESFLAFLAQAYSDPWMELSLLRGLAILASTSGLAALYIPLKHELRCRVAAFASILLCSVLAVVSYYAHQFTGDAFSLCFLGFSVAVLYTQWRYRIFAAGLLMGFAAASKITIILALPFVLALAFHRAVPSYRFPLAAFLVGLPTGFVIGCPYVWIEPVRLLKSILGSAYRSEIPSLSLLDTGSNFLSVFSVPAILLACIGLWRIWRLGQYSILVGLFLQCVIMVYAFVEAGFVNDRYYLSLTPALALLFGHAIVFGLEVKARKWIALCLLLACSGALVIENSMKYGGLVRGQWQHKMDLERLFDAIEGTDGPIFLPKLLLPYVGDRIARGSLNQAAERARNAFHLEGYRHYLQARGLPEELAAMLGRNFSEDEEALSQRLRVMAYGAEPEGWNVTFYGYLPTEPRRFGMLEPVEAQRLWQEGAASTLVLVDGMSVSLRQPPERYGPYLLFRK